MKHRIPTLIVAALCLVLGVRSVFHLADVVPFGPPLVSPDLLRASPVVVNSLIFVGAVLYSAALLIAAFLLITLHRWASRAYLAAAAIFSCNFTLIFALIKSDLVLTAACVFVLVAMPCIFLGWWIIRRQFRTASSAL